MNKAKELQYIFNDCMERMLKGETLEQCLSCYPDQAAELELLLKTVLVAQKAADVKPRPEFRERARREFLMSLREVKPARASPFLGWQPRWATALIGVLVFMLVGSGTVAAARNSMPDEPLYRVKLAAESVRLSLTPSKLGKAEYSAELADRRVKEIVSMADKGKADRVELAAELLSTHINSVASLIAPEGNEPQKQEPQVGIFMAPTPEAAPRAPSVAASPSEQAKAAGEKNDKKEDQENKRQEDKAQNSKDERAKLKEVLKRNASENPEALREIMKKASPSVKAALSKAIDAADDGYRKALENLEK